MGRDIIRELAIAPKSDRNRNMVYLTCMLGLTVQEIQTLTPEKARILNKQRRGGNPSVESIIKKWESKNGNGLMFKSVIYKDKLDPSAIFRVFSPIVKKVMGLNTGGISALKSIFKSLTSKITPPPEAKEKVEKFMNKFKLDTRTVAKIPAVSWLQAGVYDNIEVSYMGTDQLLLVKLIS